MKPNLTLDQAAKFVVFSDDSSFEQLSCGATVLLVETNIHPDRLSEIMFDVCRDYDVGRQIMEDSGEMHIDPMVPLEIEMDGGPCKIRAVTVEFLLQYYLRNRQEGGKLGIPVEQIK